MRTLILTILALTVAWHATADQRQYAADLWRDIEHAYQWPGVE